MHMIVRRAQDWQLNFRGEVKRGQDSAFSKSKRPFPQWPLHSTHCSLDRAHTPHTVANHRVLASANPSLKLHEPELLLAVPGVSSPNHHGRSEKGRLTEVTRLPSASTTTRCSGRATPPARFG